MFIGVENHMNLALWRPIEFFWLSHDYYQYGEGHQNQKGFQWNGLNTVNNELFILKKKTLTNYKKNYVCKKLIVWLMWRYFPCN